MSFERIGLQIGSFVSSSIAVYLQGLREKKGLSEDFVIETTSGPRAAWQLESGDGIPMDEMVQVFEFYGISVDEFVVLLSDAQTQGLAFFGDDTERELLSKATEAKAHKLAAQQNAKPADVISIFPRRQA